MSRVVSIRPAAPADIPAMIELVHQLFSLEKDFSFDEGRIRHGLEMLLDCGNARVLAAESDDQIVGMCSGQLTISTAEGGPAVLVEDVVVRRDWRGRGVGRMLVQGVMDWAETRQAHRLQLLADKSNQPAIDFYIHTGWRQTDLVCLRTRTP